ncbi:7003_t:CDS:1, partial [Funneliformis mosseae]
GELCYMDTSASFEQLNMSITFLYTSCTISAFLFRLFITSNELEITLEKAINLFKTILPENAFFGCSSLGLIIFLTDNSNAKYNALKTC